MSEIKLAADAVIKIGNLLGGLLNGKVSPNHWKGWRALDDKHGLPRGSNALIWVKEDGDSPKSEALNILSYMNSRDENGSLGLLDLLGYNSWHKRTFTVDDIAKKFRANGLSAEADALVNEYKAAQAAQRVNTVMPPTSGFMDSIKAIDPLSSFGGSNLQPGEPVKKAGVTGNIIATLFVIMLAIGAVFSFRKPGKYRRRK
jgi:hypothetical protein